MQGLVVVSKISARRLSSGALPGLLNPRSMTTTVSGRRHSIGSFESAPQLNPEGPKTSCSFHSVAQSLDLGRITSSHPLNELGRTTTSQPFIFQTSPQEITWLAGAPGAGKGTNSAFIASTRGYGAPTIVVSSLLETPECRRIKDAGGMVDDETVFKALLKEIKKPQYRRGVVVDGFPRTGKQAAMISDLHKTMPSTKFNFITLFIDEEASIARQLSRGDTLRNLNKVRMAGNLPPLEERATDMCEKAARLRYSNFLEQYEAINELSAKFPHSVVDASAPIDIVRQRLSTSSNNNTVPLIRRYSAPPTTLQEELHWKA